MRMGFGKTEQFADPDDVYAVARPSPTPWVLLGVALIAGAAAAVFLWMQVGAARIQASAASAELERARAERAELAQRLERMEAEKADLLALRNELTGKVQAKEEELAKLQGTYEELEAKMKEEIAKG